jgi:U3 small nucleolar RNA-associated protein 22
MDSGYLSNLSFCFQKSAKCAAFTEASMLAKIWLNQRGFAGVDGDFSGFMWDMIMSWLLVSGQENGNRILSNNYSSYQLFKQTLDFISKFDFGASALVLSKDKDILVWSIFIHIN